MAAETATPAMTWLLFALMTVATWGLYGIFLHSGQLSMADAEHGRIKSFLFVGLAYFVTAVMAPLVLLVMRGASWSFPARGIGLSLLAGTLGAIGAFCVLLAFGAKGSPTVVMSIIFAGAPIINAVVALWLHPPAGGIKALPWQFVAGILLAAIGAGMVMRYKPAPAPPPAPAKAVAVATPSSPSSPSSPS